MNFILEKKVDDANIQATCVSENIYNWFSSIREVLINMISTDFSRYGEKHVKIEIAAPEKNFCSWSRTKL